MLSVESAGTLPCAPEIPDCVEQVRGVGCRQPLLCRDGDSPAAHPALVFLPLLPLLVSGRPQSPV